MRTLVVAALIMGFLCTVAGIAYASTATCAAGKIKRVPKSGGGYTYEETDGSWPGGGGGPDGCDNTECDSGSDNYCYATHLPGTNHYRCTCTNGTPRCTAMYEKDPSSGAIILAWCEDIACQGTTDCDDTWVNDNLSCGPCQ